VFKPIHLPGISSITYSRREYQGKKMIEIYINLYLERMDKKKKTTTWLPTIMGKLHAM